LYLTSLFVLILLFPPYSHSEFGYKIHRFKFPKIIKNTLTPKELKIIQATNQVPKKTLKKLKKHLYWMPEHLIKHYILQAGKIKHVEIFINDQKYTFFPYAIRTGKYEIVFAGSDETRGRKWDIMLGGIKTAKVLIDKADHKKLNIVYELESARRTKRRLVYKEYGLELMVEIRRGFPCIAILSRFKNKGPSKCRIAQGWGPFKGKYWTTEGFLGRIVTKRFIPIPKKIGIKKWIYIHDKRAGGNGLGIITPGILGTNQDGVFINPIPSRKTLKRYETQDIVFTLTHVQVSYQELIKLYKSLMVERKKKRGG
jgi:hypothetical protein